MSGMPGPGRRHADDAGDRFPGVRPVADDLDRAARRARRFLARGTRAAAAARGEDAPAPKAKKVASKKPGEKKKKAEPQPRRRARPKTKRTTKKAALSN